MYPPNGTIRPQNLPQNQNTRIFHNSSNKAPRNFGQYQGRNNWQGQGVNGERSILIEGNYKDRAVHRPVPHYRRPRSTGSSGASTTPSASTAQSRESSVGSAAAVDASSKSPSPVNGAENRPPGLNMTKPTNARPPVALRLNSSDGPSAKNQAPSSPAKAAKGTTKPFNRKDVEEWMARRFNEAVKAIEAGQGKFYSPKSDGVEVQLLPPFNWEAFWMERKRNELNAL